MWKVILVLMLVTGAEQRLIVQQPLDGHGFATQAECDKFPVALSAVLPASWGSWAGSYSTTAPGEH